MLIYPLELENVKATNAHNSKVSNRLNTYSCYCSWIIDHASKGID